jgi:hypothetical protein
MTMSSCQELATNNVKLRIMSKFQCTQLPPPPKTLTSPPLIRERRAANSIEDIVTSCSALISFACSFSRQRTPDNGVVENHDEKKMSNSSQCPEQSVTWHGNVWPRFFLDIVMDMLSIIIALSRAMFMYFFRSPQVI